MALCLHCMSFIIAVSLFVSDNLSLLYDSSTSSIIIILSIKMCMFSYFAKSLVTGSWSSQLEADLGLTNSFDAE